MCLIAVAWQAHPSFSLVVAANRDEWRDRPTESARWWTEHPQLLAGRDLQAGGTWMGITKGGRFAAVTNFRDPSDRRSTARSRGELVTDYLLGDAPPEIFLARLTPRVALYSGFNLLAGDRENLFYLGSRDPHVMPVAPGVHGLSNHMLNEPWPKVLRARAAMGGALDDDNPAPRLFAMLSDATLAPDDQLPDTGVGLELERRLSAPLIVGPGYGTRTSTVLTVARDGHMTFDERTLTPEGAPSETQMFVF
ncbi:NRDE family protein [Pendulispora albinea]|uniref:NRDE family protein n=1 Tax=Pendulispora albinea TaxID=2741071 RepID=A0ABZ2M819_9BACT